MHGASWNGLPTAYFIWLASFGLRDAGVVGQHRELADAALVMQGMSNGGCWVNKLVSEIPSRVMASLR